MIQAWSSLFLLVIEAENREREKRNRDGSTERRSNVRVRREREILLFPEISRMNVLAQWGTRSLYIGLGGGTSPCVNKM